MELFMPESEAENAKMKEAIKKISDFHDTVHVGATMVGNDYPYNINTGKIVKYELKIESDFIPNTCLCLTKLSSKNEVVYDFTHCLSEDYNFICQKIKP